MNTITSLMAELLDVAKKMREGKVPSVYQILAIQGELSDHYYRLNQDQAQQFSAKERAYLERKIAQARANLKGRETYNVSDSSNHAIEQTRLEADKEILEMTHYEKSRLLCSSVKNAIEYCRSLRSSVETSEKFTPNQL